MLFNLTMKMFVFENLLWANNEKVILSTTSEKCC